MAKKTDFSGINTQRRMNVAEVLQTEISTKGQQGKASKEESERRAAEGRTQGRKGCKAVRINMAFWTENYCFIEAGARAYGMTMTKFCNKVLESYRADHPEVQAKADEAKKNAESLEL